MPRRTGEFIANLQPDQNDRDVKRYRKTGLCLSAAITAAIGERKKNIRVTNFPNLAKGTVISFIHQGKPDTTIV